MSRVEGEYEYKKKDNNATATALNHINLNNQKGGWVDVDYDEWQEFQYIYYLCL